MSVIALGSDHAGFRLKATIRAQLEQQGVTVLDLGCKSEERTDYPLWGHAVARAVADGQASAGIVVCGSGIGISMAANKVPGVRAALATDVTMARLARQHNDANVLALGQRITGEAVALDIVAAFLESGFEGGRHAARVAQIDDVTALPSPE